MPVVACCPLCADRAGLFAEDRVRRYLRCDHCALVFADPASHPDAAAEKAVYDQHQNHPDDPGYRRFLSRLATPLLDRLRPGMHGLDYGSGPGPTLSVMLEEAGMRMAIYDPFYAPDRGVLGRRYDFVTCAEVVEHFHHPGRAWAELVDLLAPGGWLGVMTKRVLSRERFRHWHYKNDPTHVSFYSETTFQWLARHHGLTVAFPAADVALLHKPRG